MNSIPIQDVWFDDAVTLTMGEAFDHLSFLYEHEAPAERNGHGK